MAQWVRYLATKPEDLSLILRTDRVNIINSCNYSLNATCTLWYVSLSFPHTPTLVFLYVLHKHTHTHK